MMMETNINNNLINVLMIIYRQSANQSDAASPLPPVSLGD